MILSGNTCKNSNYCGSNKLRNNMLIYTGWNTEFGLLKGIPKFHRKFKMDYTHFKVQATQ